MPGLQCSYGDVARLDMPMPFFLRDAAFTEFRNESYSWDPTQNVTVLVKSIRRSSKPSTSTVTTPNSAADVSLGGCPLECPFDPNENFDEAIKPIGPPPIFVGLEFSMNQYEAMDLPTCRGLVKKIYEGDESTVQSLCLNRAAGKQAAKNPIYVACDGSPSAKDLVMIGFNDEKFLELRMMGPYKKQSTQLNLELFLAYHQHLPNVNPSSIHRQVHAVYEKIHGEHTSEGKVFMEFLWNDPKALFESPPVNSARAKLAIQPKPGDANPHLIEIWEEIKVIDKLMGMWETTRANEMDRSTLEMSLAAGDVASRLIEDMKVLLSKQTGPTWRKGCTDEYSDSMDDALVKVVQMDRQDLDFVDRAWTIMRKSSSWAELIQCYHTMFRAVESKMYRPYLLPSNASMLGEMLKAVMTGQIGNYRAKLNPLLVIEMTLDCGILKLYKDYTYVLGMCHLAEPREMKIFLPQRRLFRESLISIKKLHCMLEILCLSRERLAIPMTDQESQTRKLIEYFSKNPLDWNRIFHFDIPINSIQTSLSRMHPVYWNLKLESSSTARVARTNAILARDFFIGHAKKFYTAADGIIPRGYYLYVHRIAQRKM